MGMQSRKRCSGTSTRSLSSPPSFAADLRRSGTELSMGSGSPADRDSEVTDSASPVNTGQRSSVASTPLGHRRRLSPPKSTPVGHSESFDILREPNVRNGSRQPLKHDPQPEMTEDFCEGGVELSPSEGAHRDERSPPRPTRPLPPAGEAQLDEFWPPAGEGARALFLDYDGTLREFEARPEMATPTAEIEELLKAINAREDFAPHIISGRDAKFLAQCFSHLDRFTLIAEHGFQICRPGSDEWELTDHPDGLDRYHDDWKAIVRTTMSSFVDAIPRSHIEEKASSLVWHYREVPDQEKASAFAEQALVKLERLRDKEKIHKIRISHGHKVVEVSYRKVRKGPVMRRICEEKATYGTPFLSVLVAGDDVSDESMFDASPHDFLTIKVGPAETAAKFRVDTPADLRRFLRDLIAS
eukprot:TRINITY_DN12049_c0_g1_i1.p1 TRINITY_DN12049_c0_g1~~TRINITY_DN12049_c0_g1_i1.p1  ORF type:complete len:414 (-),score=64.24 TRINITY_DN12049_c0_g1_i1:310-1551(-)